MDSGTDFREGCRAGRVRTAAGADRRPDPGRPLYPASPHSRPAGGRAGGAAGETDGSPLAFESEARQPVSGPPVAVRGV